MTEKYLTALCHLSGFFLYAEPYMLMMRALWEQNYIPSDIRQYLA